MRIFHNRPLAFFCFVFIALSLLISDGGRDADLIAVLLLAIAAIIISAITVCIVILNKKRQRAIFRLCFVLFAIIAAILAPLSHYFLDDAKRDSALLCTGERYVSFTVIEEKYEGSYSSEYLVITEGVDGKAKRLRCTMVCAFPDAFDVGEKIYAKVDIKPSGEEILGYIRYAEIGEYVQGAIYERSHFAIISEENENLEIKINKIKLACSRYMDRIFGEDSALAKGFLLGDTEELPVEILRDFRRSGTSHLLAVSGLHISVILGSLGFLLEKLYVSKRARSVIISFAAFALLALTGFSMSACRSVFMLWIVYISYLYLKENDPLTTLFLAVSIIMLLLPSSVKDVGLWLSFLATLGLITAWQPISVMLSRGNRSGVKGRAKYILKRIFLSLLLTFICNAFICFVVWICFGEISTVAILSNPVLSPLSSVYMILVLLSCMVPPLSYVTVILGDVIVYIARLFSGIDGAVISLEYPFAPPIIIIMTLAIAVMLVIKLPKKTIILLPPALGVIAFGICLSVHSAVLSDSIFVDYYSEDKNELFVITDGNSSVVCDMSYGSYSFMSNTYRFMSGRYSTEISDLVLTHYHARHPASVEKMLRKSIVRRVCLPSPRDSVEIEYAKAIAELCMTYGADIYIYSDSERLDIGEGAFCAFYREDKREDGEHPSLCAMICKGNEAVAYISPESHNSSLSGVADILARECINIIFGSHGVEATERYSYSFREDAECVFYSSVRLYSLSDVRPGEYNVYIKKNEEDTEPFALIID